MSVIGSMKGEQVRAKRIFSKLSVDNSRQFISLLAAGEFWGKTSKSKSIDIIFISDFKLCYQFPNSREGRPNKNFIFLDI